MCGAPSAGSPVQGRLRYTRTANQFGGPAVGAFNGVADLAVPVAALPPCSYGGGANPNCLAAFANATPIAPAAVGGSFGLSVQAAAAPNMPGVFHATIAANGQILALFGGFATVPGEAVTSFGAPWTTGMITVSVSGAVPMAFMTTGTDLRTPAGSGVVSMVAGSVSVRTLTGPSANRGHLTLMVPEPRVMAGSAAAGLMLAVCHSLVRRRSTRAGNARAK
jgi:hypothetical protein